MALPVLLQGIQIPQPVGLINDFAQVIPLESEARMDRLVSEVRTKSGGEITVVTIADIEDNVVSDVALQIGRQWKVGEAAEPGDPARNTGTVVLLVPKETNSSGRGECRIETGRGSEAFVTDGMAASREHIPRKSDFNLLIIVQRLDLAHVQSVSAAARQWAEAGNPPPLTFTEAEWRASGDIFPMEYADVIEGHRVLFGSFALSDAAVDLEHLRLQLEQEAMGKLLGLRQGAMIAGSNGRARVELLEGAWSRILVLLRGLIRLHGERLPGENHAILARAAQLASLDGDALLRLLESATGRIRLRDSESDTVLYQTLVSLEGLVSHVNSFRPAARTYAATASKAQKGDSPR